VSGSLNIHRKILTILMGFPGFNIYNKSSSYDFPKKNVGNYLESRGRL
jgi:hypothetical protein